MACVLSMILVPIILSWTKTNTVVTSNEESAKEEELSGFLHWCVDITKSSSRIPVMIVFFAMFGVPLFGMSRLQVEHEPLSWFPEEHPTKVAMDVLDRDFGGAVELTVWVKATDGKSMLSFAHLQDVYELEKRILEYNKEDSNIMIRRGLGILETLRLNYEMGEPKNSFDDLIHNKGALSQFIYNLHISRPNWASGVIAKDGKSAKNRVQTQLAARTKISSLTKIFGHNISRFREKRNLGTCLGVLYTLLATFGVLVDDLILSFGFAVVVISVLMFVFLRDIRLSFILLGSQSLTDHYDIGMYGFSKHSIGFGDGLVCIDCLGYLH